MVIRRRRKKREGARFLYSAWDGTQVGFDYDAQDLLKELTDDLVGLIVGLSIGEVLPEHDLIAPRVDERRIAAAELRPVVLAPQLGRSKTHSGFKDAFEGVIFADENPCPQCTAARIQMGRLGRIGILVRTQVGSIRNPHMEVANLAG